MRRPTKSLRSAPPPASIRGPRVQLQLKSDARLVKQQAQLMHERAADIMRNMIIEGEILPGSRMPEIELCELLGISRTPLREALKVLAAEGLLILTPQRGAMVAELDVAELDATIEAVAHIEAAAARIACDQAGDRELQAIAALHEQMVEADAARNEKRYFRINQELHGAIVKASHNPVLVELHGRASTHLKRLRYRKTEQTSAKYRKTFIAQHAAIVDALLKRDQAAADRAVLTHLFLVGEMVGVQPTD